MYQFQAVDLGNLFHGALERFAKKMEIEGCTWTTITDVQKEAFIENSVEECIVDYGNTILYSSARNEYVITRLKRMMHRTGWALAKQLAKSSFTPSGYEVVFGESIPLDELGRMRLYGKIDRVDLCEDDENVYIKIMDYKTGAKAFDLGELCYGLQMQLVLYMDAAMAQEQRKHTGKQVVPAGIFYYQIKDPVVDKVNDAEKVERAILKELRPDGVVNASKNVIDLMEQPSDGVYTSIPVSFNKDGSLSKRSQVLTEEEFKLIAEFAKYQAKETGKKILQGNIDVAPYELGEHTGCDYCPYHAVCGFETQIPGYEYKSLKKLDKEGAMFKMREAMV